MLSTLLEYLAYGLVTVADSQEFGEFLFDLLNPLYLLLRELGL